MAETNPTNPNIVVSSGKPVTIKRTPDYKSYYANQSRVRISQFDIELQFGQMRDDPNALGVFTNEEFLSLILAPQTAKLVMLGLQSAVLGYEAQFGEIKVPEAVQKQADALRNAVLLASTKAAKEQGN